MGCLSIELFTEGTADRFQYKLYCMVVREDDPSHQSVHLSSVPTTAFVHFGGRGIVPCVVE